MFNLVLQECHLTLDRLFRSVIEDSNYGRHVGRVGLDDELKSGESKLGFGAWVGMRAGVSRAELLLALVADFFASSTTVQVNLPYGAFLNLCSRVFSVVPPAPVGASPVLKKKVLVAPNTSVEKSERDLLLASISTLHAEALVALDFSVQRLAGGILSFGTFILEQLVWIFTTNAWNKTIRNAVYDTLRSLLNEIGLGLNAASAKTISLIITTLLADLIPPPPPAQISGNTKNVTSLTTHHADSFLASHAQAAHTASPAAIQLLPVLITRLPYLRSELRTQIDRTAILTGNKDAVLASVLYPPQYVKASLMPFLREWDGAMDVEGTVRPRVWNAVGSKVEFRDLPEEEPEEEEEQSEEGESEDEVMEDAEEQLRAEAEEATVEKLPQVPQRVENSVFAQAPPVKLSPPTQPEQSESNVDALPSPKRQRTEMAQISIERSVTETFVMPQTIAPKAAAPAAKPDTTFAQLAQKDEDSDMEIPEINMDGDTSDEDGSGEEE